MAFYYRRHTAAGAIAGFGLFALAGLVFEILWTFVWLVFTGVIVLTAACLFLGARASRAILHRRYAQPATGEIPLAARLRLRAAELRMLDGDDVPQAPSAGELPAPAAVPGEAERERRVADLFSVPCTGGCEAEAGFTCMMTVIRDGKLVAPPLPLALVRRAPGRIAVCHLSRMALAVAHGAASEEEVAAQFGGNLPGEVARELTVLASAPEATRRELAAWQETTLS